ncbi:hypothetical protein [Serratia fonticola]|uniref:hypothetical protein n=1 Tax=Serratia fonticola TaxID=47917 RepID=UPI0015C5D7FF|nr:hypothetical protein [Serratia fonticola]NYA45745.1 hypothetical protein [Serratia fonticola]CAI1685222.1 Uncharacterised protein [Serratia fonticola]
MSGQQVNPLHNYIISIYSAANFAIASSQNMRDAPRKTSFINNALYTSTKLEKVIVNWGYKIIPYIVNDNKPEVVSNPPGKQGDVFFVVPQGGIAFSHPNGTVLEGDRQGIRFAADRFLPESFDQFKIEIDSALNDA